MQHPDEGTIHAWLDGALPPDEGRAIEEHAATCAACAAAIAEARGLIAGSSRILAALDAVPGGVLPSAESVDALGSGRVRLILRPAWWQSVPLRAAAAIVLVGSVSWLATRSHVQREVTLAAPVAIAPATEGKLAADTTATPTTATTTVASAEPAISTPQPGRTAQANVTGELRGLAVPRPAPVPSNSASRREAANVVTQQSAEVADAPVARVPASSPVAPPSVASGNTGGGAAAKRAAAASASDEQRLAASSLAKSRTPMAAMSAPMVARLMPGRDGLRRLTGCYALEQIPQSEADRDAGAPAASLLPTRIELLEERADTSDPAAMIARPAPGQPPLPTTAHASWKTLGDNEIILNIADSTRSLTAMLTLAGDSVGGWARASAGGKDDVVATVHGRRTECTTGTPDR
jgi:hypothetical protein